MKKQKMNNTEIAVAIVVLIILIVLFGPIFEKLIY